MLAAVVLIVVLICSLAIDTSQITYIRCQLRAVADAAAIAGAQDLSSDISKCDQHALSVANDYLRNALKVDPDDGVTSVSTVVTPPGPDELGKVRVTVHMTVKNIMLAIINRPLDDVTVSAVAGGLGRITRHSGFKLFPLAVSIDALPGNGSTGKTNNGNGKGTGAAGGGGNGNGGNSGGNGNGNGNSSSSSSSSTTTTSSSSNGNGNGNGNSSSSTTTSSSSGNGNGNGNGNSSSSTTTTSNGNSASNGQGNTTATTSGDGTGSGANGGDPSLNTYFDHRPLRDLRIGDLVYLHLNSQTFKNAAWTSFTVDPTSGNWIHHAVDQCLGFEDVVPGYIPSVNIGEEINLNNGVLGEKKLAGDSYLQALRNEPILYLPVIRGEEPFNQHRTLLGFVGVHVENVIVNQKGGAVETIVARIVKGIDHGGAGVLPGSGNATDDAAINNWNPYSIKLIE